MLESIARVARTREKEEKRNEYAAWPIRIQNVNARVEEVGLGGALPCRKKK